MVEYTKGQKVVVVSNKVIKHGFKTGQVCQIERLYSSNHAGYSAYEMFYVDLKGKYTQILSTADIRPLDIESNELALGFLEEKSPW